MRIDQVMAFAWKGLLPLTLLNIVVSAIELQIWNNPTVGQLWIMSGINLAVMVASILVLGRFFGPRVPPAPNLQGTREISMIPDNVRRMS